jgi:hypothetical protein
VKPDFSGEYVLDRPASSLSPAASAMTGATLRIEHREPRFKCAGKLVAGDAIANEFTFEIPTIWDGDVLVNQMHIDAHGPAFTMTWRYELLDGGLRLRATETIRGGGRDQDSVWTFTRVSFIPSEGA